MPVKCCKVTCQNRITGRPEDDGSALCEQCQQAEVGTNCGNCHDIEYIENELLMFLNDKFTFSSATMMKMALVSICNDNEVRLAKDILWDVQGEELLGKPLKRNHVPDNPSAHHEKEVEDIQNVFFPS